MQMKSKLLTSILILSGILSVFALIQINNKQSSCISIYVDFQKLDNDRKIIECIDQTEKIDATTFIQKAGIEISGTEKYGSDIICRVNQLPSYKVEPCISMPPEDAYWAIIIKNHKFLIFIIVY